MRRNRVIGISGAVAGVVAASILLWNGGDDPDGRDGSPAETTVGDRRRLADLARAAGFGNPRVVSIPPPTDAAAFEWLEGEGATAVEMLAFSEGLWASGAQACQEVAGALDGIGTPSELLAAAAGTPDAPTRDLLVGLHTAIESVFRACGDDAEVFEAVQAEFAWQWSLSDRRLTELGVRR